MKKFGEMEPRDIFQKLHGIISHKSVHTNEAWFEEEAFHVPNFNNDFCP
jgi:hypothetical protein